MNEEDSNVDVVSVYLKRLKRKVDVMRLDAKSRGYGSVHDLGEMMAIVERIEDVLERRERGIK